VGWIRCYGAKPPAFITVQMFRLISVFLDKVYVFYLIKHVMLVALFSDKAIFRIFWHWAFFHLMKRNLWPFNYLLLQGTRGRWWRWFTINVPPSSLDLILRWLLFYLCCSSIVINAAIEQGNEHNLFYQVEYVYLV
jgi:hypothetical protein